MNFQKMTSKSEALTFGYAAKGVRFSEANQASNLGYRKNQINGKKSLFNLQFKKNSKQKDKNKNHQMNVIIKYLPYILQLLRI